MQNNINKDISNNLTVGVANTAVITSTSKYLNGILLRNNRAIVFFDLTFKTTQTRGASLGIWRFYYNGVGINRLAPNAISGKINGGTWTNFWMSGENYYYINSYEWKSGQVCQAWGTVLFPV